MVISILSVCFNVPVVSEDNILILLFENMSTLVLFSTRYKFQLATLWLVKDFFVFFYNSAVIIVTAIEKLGHCLFIVGSLGSPYGNEKLHTQTLLKSTATKNVLKDLLRLQNIPCGIKVRSGWFQHYMPLCHYNSTWFVVATPRRQGDDVFSNVNSCVNRIPRQQINLLLLMMKQDNRKCYI